MLIEAGLEISLNMMRKIYLSILSFIFLSYLTTQVNRFQKKLIPLYSEIVL
jgi:hypothetical protein